jgi:hypothetical protein
VTPSPNPSANPVGVGRGVAAAQPAAREPLRNQWIALSPPSGGRCIRNVSGGQLCSEIPNPRRPGGGDCSQTRRSQRMSLCATLHCAAARNAGSRTRCGTGTVRAARPLFRSGASVRSAGTSSSVCPVTPGGHTSERPPVTGGLSRGAKVRASGTGLQQPCEGRGVLVMGGRCAKRILHFAQL